MSPPSVSSLTDVDLLALQFPFVLEISTRARVSGRGWRKEIARTMATVADDYLYSGKVMLAAVISLSVVIFLVVLHLYARWPLRRRRRRPPVVVQRVLREPPPSNQAPPLPGHAAEVRLSVCGLDRKVVEPLPVFVYRAEEHKRGLECVVCLRAMESGRRLPACGHAFHVDCIDTWLTSHATCPICRAPVKITEDEAAAVEVFEYCEEAAAGQVLESRAVEGEAAVEIILSPGRDQVTKEDESSPSTSFGASLMRMLSRGRSQRCILQS